MRRPLRRWSDRRLDTIVQSEIRGFLNDWQTEGAQPATLERARVLLAGLFRAALQDKKITDSPMTHIGVIKTTPRDRVLSREHEALLRGLAAPQWDRVSRWPLALGSAEGSCSGCGR
jgi:site-specific recombinase XerD